MLSPTRKAIADELDAKIKATEALIEVLEELKDIVVSSETMTDLHAGFYRIYKKGNISDEHLKDWMKFLDKHVGSEILDREQE